jgi:hypothetical protein
MTRTPFRGNFALHELILLSENQATKNQIELAFTEWVKRSATFDRLAISVIFTTTSGAIK